MQQVYYDLWTLQARRTTGMRTDWITGHDQGYQLPFGWNLDLQRALEFMEQHGNKLVYIVACGGQVKAECNGVALRLDSEHAFFEINLKEPGIAQRHMYKHPDNLTRFVLGPPGYCYWLGQHWRSYRPEDMSRWSFDTVYRQLFLHSEHELTFSVRDKDRSIVLW
jgi:hypothetical protein